MSSLTRTQPVRLRANALYRTPDETCAMLKTLHKAGAEYVFLTVSGGKEQLQRFAREIVPEFSNI